jgi:alpha-glucosidase
VCRPGFVCTLNTLAREVELPVPGRPVLSTAALHFTGGSVHIPADTCVWWAV